MRCGREEPAVSRALVAELYALQQLDLAIDRGGAEVEALRRALAEDATRPAREAEARSRALVQRARRAVQEAETALQEVEARIRKQETRLYGGGIGPRDLDALQNELAHLRATHAEQEERALALMLAAEEAEAAAAQAAETHGMAQRDWEQRQVELRGRLAAAEATQQELQTRRASQTAALEAAALERYEAIRRTHAGRAVAAVQAGTCQVCRVAVTSGALQRARTGAELVPCSNCGRILYVP
jgi:predicted  nucleic acid-binding Zn-ribbon protein